MRGQLVGLVPYGYPEIAYGVTEVAFDREMEGGNVTVDSFYEFTDEQLVALVQKGFFNEGFEPPNDLLNQIWELPAHYKGIVIAPRNEQEAPLAFLDVLDRDGLIIDAMTSGLDLVDYFPDYLTEIRSRDQENDKTVDHTLERTDHVNDIFAGMESQYDDGGSDGRVNEAEGASIAQALSAESGAKNALPVMDSPLFDALMRNTQITLGNEKTEDALTNESQTGSTFSVTDELKAAEDQQATITTAGLASTFREVMGDFIDSSVTKNTPAPEVINPVDTETEIGVPEGSHESVTEVKRDLERKRASVRENVEVVTKEDINSLSFNEEPDF